MFTDDEIGFTPDLHLGMADIDAEHRELFVLLHRLRLSPERATNSESFTDIITKIGSHLNVHFQSEEKLFPASALTISEIEAHKHAHEAILMQLVELNMTLMIGMPPDYNSTMNRITDWIVSHVRAYDFKLRVA